MVFVHSEWQFYALRFVIGAMEAGFAPGILYYLTLWFPKSHRGRMTSVFFLATAFSGIIGAPISGLILDTERAARSGRLAMAVSRWRHSLRCAGFVVLLRFDDGIEQAEWFSDEERRLISVQLDRQKKRSASIRHGARCSCPACCCSDSLLPDPDRLLRPGFLGARPDQEAGGGNAA